MLIRPEALERAGGIAAIRSEIIDDCALAARVKGSGGKVWLGVTEDTPSLRQYTSIPEVERMIARTAFNQLGHSALILIGALLGLALLYLLPLGLIVGTVLHAAPEGGEQLRYGAGDLLGFVGYGLMCIAYFPMVRFYGLSPAWALTLPFSALFYMYATLHSAVKYWTGRGGEWKGRAQDHAG